MSTLRPNLLLLGMMLGWWLVPVQWVNAGPVQLNPVYQTLWVQMAADSYAVTLNEEDARANYCAFNVGGGRRVTVNQFARVMAAAAGRQDLEPHSTGEYRFGDTRHISSDVGALRALGWELQGNIEGNASARQMMVIVLMD